MEAFHHDNDNLDEWHDKQDCLYIIDGRLNLFKVARERMPRLLYQYPLSKHKLVQTVMETQVRNNDFIRLGINDRCLTIKGRVINFVTGHEWPYILDN